MSEGITANEIWNTLDYDQKLAATMIVFEHIKDHIMQGGTYRYLIYDRLGFKEDAYMHLLSDGMFISNYISENQDQED